MLVVGWTLTHELFFYTMTAIALQAGMGLEFIDSCQSKALRSARQTSRSRQTSKRSSPQF